MPLTYDVLPNNVEKTIILGTGVLVNCSETCPRNVAACINANRDLILGVTSNGITFTALPVFTNFTTELQAVQEWQYMRFDGWQVTMTGTMQTLTDDMKNLMTNVNQGANLWWIGDYGTAGTGLAAIRMNDAHSTGGFTLQTYSALPADVTFTFTAFYPNDTTDPAENVPFVISLTTEPTEE